MIAGKTVKVNVKDTDRYGRYVGIVSTDKIKDYKENIINRWSLCWKNIFNY